jgi:hypothetical protein
MPKQTSKYSIS